MKQGVSSGQKDPVITMSVVDEVREVVSRAVPDAPEVEAVMARLLEMGLRTKQDLKYVVQADLEGVIPVLQVRRLLDHFKMENKVVTLDLAVLPAFPEMPPLDTLPTSSPAHNSQASPQHQRKHWAEAFQVPWSIMPGEITFAVTSEKRPSPAARRQFVRILADEICKKQQYPTRAECLTVCRAIVQEYPKSFTDVREDGQVINGGYLSLLVQVKNRIDNLNRNSEVRKYREAKKPREGKRGPKDTYGCTQFQPGLPEGESEESMEASRQRLTDIYCRSGRQGAETAEVSQLMAATFYLQRRQLNAMPPPTIVNLKSKWPYLFTPKGLIGHFQLLTDMQVLRALEVAMEDCGNIIVDLFKTRPTNAAVKEVLNNHTHSDDLPYKVLKLLMAHFNEDVGGLIVQADGCATVADIESSSLPVTPRLILLGEPQDHHQRWMVSVESSVLCEGTSMGTFITGLGTFFSTYYIFNLEYQDEAACTLEFIQRCLVGINPERGTKAGGKKKRKAPSQVSSLLRKLMDFRYSLV